MDWILIGIVAGSLVTGTFSTEEACLGRAAMLEKQHVRAKCVEAPKSTSSLISNGAWCLDSSGGHSC